MSITEQQDLIEILKFVPRKFTITLSGYGGEIVLGKIDRATFDYWTVAGEDKLAEFVSEWHDDAVLDVPKEFQFVAPGYWHDCDDLAHNTGVELSRLCQLTVYDSLDQSAVFTCELDLVELATHGVTVDECVDVDIDELESETTAFVGQSIEKGVFFSADIELSRPFDPSLLSISYSTYHGWSLVENVGYGGDESLDGTDGYSTRGKSTNFEVVANYNVDEELFPAEKAWEQQDIDESLLSEWIPSSLHNPVYPGKYQIQASSFLYPLQMAVWCNESWQYENSQPVNSVVVAWRGVNYPTC